MNNITITTSDFKTQNICSKHLAPLYFFSLSQQKKSVVNRVILFQQFLAHEVRAVKEG